MDVVKREMSKLNVVKTSVFQWTPGKAAAAMMLAEGYTFKAVAKEIGKTERTLFRWNNDIEFSAEVDRLTLMVGISSRAERLRLAKRVIRQQDHGGILVTDKDLLDWLKFAQSETDGIKLNLAALNAALGQDDASVANGGLDGVRKAKTV